MGHGTNPVALRAGPATVPDGCVEVSCRVFFFGEVAWFERIRDGKERREKTESEEEIGVWVEHNRGTNELWGHGSGIAGGLLAGCGIKQNCWNAEDGADIKGTFEEINGKRDGSGRGDAAVLLHAGQSICGSGC